MDILRSIYYGQNLPSSVFSVGATWVRAEHTTLLQGKFITERDGKFELTDMGSAALRKLAGGRIPPMIRMERSIFHGKRKDRKFIVGRSLAKELFREVSAGG